jgi:DNA-binding GntR family transcriptional regulator
MTNGSNARLDRIEKIIEAMAKAQRERDMRSEKRHLEHERTINRVDARVTRFLRLGVKEARNQRRRIQVIDKKITQLAAAQLITEENLQQFLSWRGTNGSGKRAAE